MRGEFVSRTRKLARYLIFTVATSTIMSWSCSKTNMCYITTHWESDLSMRDQSIVAVSVETCFLGFGRKHMNGTSTEVHYWLLLFMPNLTCQTSLYLERSFLMIIFWKATCQSELLFPHLLGQVDIPNRILVSSFADSLSTVECQLIKACLTPKIFQPAFSASSSICLVSLAQGKCLHLRIYVYTLFK